MRVLLALVMLSIAAPAHAHTVNVTYLDIQQKPEGLVMTAALQPHQALVIAGLRHDDSDTDEGGFADLIPELQAHADVIAAYAATHVTITANDEECAWDPNHVDVPTTELSALADGVTVSGPITCDTVPLTELFIGTSLLFDAFPTSLTIVRLEYPNGFADKFTLTSENPQGRLALDATPTVHAEPEQKTSRTATIAGWVLLIFVLAGIVFAVSRTAPTKD